MQFAPLEDREVRAYEETHCRRCAYPLRGLPGRFCPRCGAPRELIAPEQTPRSQSLKSVRSAPLIGGPGFAFHTGVIGACVSALLSQALPGWAVPLAVLAIGGLGLLGLAWLARVISLAFTALVRGSHAVSRGAARRMALAPMIVLLSFAMIAIKLPSHVAFRLSRPAMDEWVERVMAGEYGAMRERWIGIYPARDISFTADGVWFRTPWTMPNGGSGFVYSPRGRLNDRGEMRFVRRSGHWYEWRHDY